MSHFPVFLEQACLGQSVLELPGQCVRVCVCVCVCVCVGVDVITVVLGKVTAKPSQFLWCCLGNLYASATHEIKDFYLMHFLKECMP